MDFLLLCCLVIKLSVIVIGMSVNNGFHHSLTDNHDDSLLHWSKHGWSFATQVFHCSHGDIPVLVVEDNNRRTDALQTQSIDFFTNALLNAECTHTPAMY